MATQKVPITVAHGDGIGPEIMNATLHILKEAGAALDIETVEIGEQVYKQGIQTGIAPETWDSIKRTKAFLKAPITTPQGGGFKSLNVTVRTTLGLFANIRPCCSYAPFIATKHPNMDVVIIRENEEDLYAGIEYQQCPDSVHSIKLFSRQGTEKICRFAFTYAMANQRKKVSCFTKDNIMKLSDGLFHKIYEEVGEEYSQLEKEHWIVDIGSAKLADTPEAFDVIVLPNLYGDILSDVAAQISGSVGLAGSANIGTHGAMFEAIHGSAPRRAGQDMANPSGLLMGAVMMLAYLGQTEEAERVHNAWLTTIEQGIHTYDIYTEQHSKKKVGTKAFAQAVAANLGKLPQTLPPKQYRNIDYSQMMNTPLKSSSPKRELLGIDLFVHQSPTQDSVDRLVKLARQAELTALPLQLITNRGVKVWPDTHTETFCIDQWRCRFYAKDGTTLKALAELHQKAVQAGLDVVKTENLYAFDGEKLFSHAE